MRPQASLAVNATPTPHIEQQPVVLCAEAGKAGNGDPDCKGFPDANTHVLDTELRPTVAAAGFVAKDPRATLDFRLAPASKVPSGWDPAPLESVGPFGCCRGGCANC